MKKDAYYFPHFCNARHDRKVKRIIKDLGIEGYGIYFMILEVLREQTEFKYPIEDIDLLADEFGCSEAKLKAVVSKYDLFKAYKNHFTSPKLILFLQPYLERSKRARAAANKRWKNVNSSLENPSKKINKDANAYANALPEQCESECKESKVKETKVINAQIATVSATAPLISFELFWNQYGKKLDKKRAEYEWSKLSPTDKKLALSFIPKFKEYYQQKSIELPYPKRYLRNKRWKDELEIEKKAKGSIPQYKDIVI